MGKVRNHCCGEEEERDEEVKRKKRVMSETERVK